MIRPYLDKTPRIGKGAWVEESAQVVGDVVVGEDTGIWFNSVVRGDVNYIRIGKRTNIQDGSILHVTRETHPLIVGDNVTVGHGVILHGCTIHSNCLIGMGSIVMDGAEVGPNSIVAAGALVPERKKIPPGWLAVGSPARLHRELTPQELDWIQKSADNYVRGKEDYQ